MVTIINMCSRLGNDLGYALKKKDCKTVRVRCFVDPNIHPDLLPCYHHNYYSRYHRLFGALAEITVSVICLGRILSNILHSSVESLT